MAGASGANVVCIGGKEAVCEGPNPKTAVLATVPGLDDSGGSTIELTGDEQVGTGAVMFVAGR